MPVYRNARLRLLDLNTHVGWSIRNGTLADLVDRLAPDVTFLQEVRRRDLDDLRRVLGPAWSITGHCDTVVCLRLPRFVLLRGRSPEITFGEKYERHASRVVAVDTVTGRRLRAQSVHVQPLGRGLVRANRGARRRQTRQLRAYARWQGRSHSEAVCVDGGDVNQNLRVRPDDLPPKIRGRSAYAVWARLADMEGAHDLHRRRKRPARLDAFFVRDDDFVTVRRHRVVETHRNTDDHPAVFSVLRVKALK